MESGFFLFRWHLELMTQERYFNKIIDRFEHLTQQSVKNNIIFKVSFCKDDFVKDYNSYKEMLTECKYIVANRVPEAKTKSKKSR
jgi:phytoene desaturase